MKEIITSSAALEKIRSGVNKVADIVKMTIGPKGNNVILDRQYGSPLITNDGVTIAKEIFLKDPFENVGANLVKEAAVKTNDVAGDGTTTATILAQAMVNEGIKNIANGAKAIEVRKGMEEASKQVVALIRKQAKAVTTKEEVANVATISSGNTEIGKMIAEVLETVGKDGIISVEESNGLEVEREIVAGMQFNAGFLSPYFITQDAKAILVNPLILITDHTFNLSQQYIPLLEKMVNDGGKKNILIVADNVQGEALASLILNKMQGRLNVVAVKAPYFGEKKMDFLEDLAVLTGGKVISQALNMRVEDASLNDLGSCRRVEVDKNNSIVIDGDGNAEALAKRIKEIKAIIPANQFEKDTIKERLAKLSGGIGIIKVGAATEMELKEKKMRIEDAVEATKSAAEEGIVAGGGIALFTAYNALKNDLKGDKAIGYEIVKQSLLEPLRQIVENAGKSGDVIMRDLRTIYAMGTGYNAETDEFYAMIEHGIIDPAKVVRSALQNAASVAASLLTTQAIIVDEKEVKDA